MTAGDSERITIAIGQLAAEPDWAANLRTCLGFIERAVEGGASLLVLPEGSMARFRGEVSDEQFRASYQPLDGPFLTGIAEATSANGLTVVVGARVLVDGHRRNTLAVFRKGQLLTRYDKLHLMDALGKRESDFVEASEDGLVTFECDGFKFGLLTCYDVRFPEMSRLLALSGAEVLVLPAAWVAGPFKEHQWSTMVTARAMENTCYVVASGECGPTNVGMSMFVDPQGNVRGQLGNQPGMLWCEIERDFLEGMRESMPVLRQRRFEINPTPTKSPRNYVADPIPADEILAARGARSNVT